MHIKYLSQDTVKRLLPYFIESGFKTLLILKKLKAHLKVQEVGFGSLRTPEGLYLVVTSVKL